jgi:SP family general alpha glucoside:H+ symporter-like MFS transporter
MLTASHPVAILFQARHQIGCFVSNGDIFSPLSETVPGLCDLTPGARTATRAEQRMTWSQAFRVYPKAIFWSALLSSTIIMDGHDMSLLTSFFTFPVFQGSYGSTEGDEQGRYYISQSCKLP